MDKAREEQDSNNFTVVTAKDALSHKALQCFMTACLLNYNEILLGVLFHFLLYFFKPYVTFYFTSFMLPFYHLTSRLVLKIQSKDVIEYLGAEVSLCVSLFMRVDEEMDSF